MIATAKDKPVLVRIPEWLLRRIDSSAKRQGRSRNSEILMRVSSSFTADQARK